MANWLQHLTRFAALLASSGTVFLMISTVADVGRRELTGQPIPGVIEVSEVVLVAVVFLGVAYAQREKQHVATTVLTDRLPRRVSGWLRIISYLLIVLLVLWMVQATGAKALESYRKAEYRFGITSVPIWPARVAIPVGLTLLLGELVRDLLSSWNAVRRGEPPRIPRDEEEIGVHVTPGLPE